MPSVLHNDIRVHYRVAGPAKSDGGPPMVLVHANPFDHTLWLYQIARFSTWFRVLAVDRPGHGFSRRPRGGAADTLRLDLLDLAVSRVDVAGREAAFSHRDGVLRVPMAGAPDTVRVTVTYTGANQTASGFTASGLVGGETEAVLTRTSVEPRGRVRLHVPFAFGRIVVMRSPGSSGSILTSALPRACGAASGRRHTCCEPERADRK